MSRTSNVEWVRARLSFMRILESSTPRQRELIRLFDQNEELTKADIQYLHSLATAEKNEIQATEAKQREAIIRKANGYAERRARNHQMFLAAGMLSEAGILDKHTGAPLYAPEKLLEAFKGIRDSLGTPSP